MIAVHEPHEYLGNDSRAHWTKSFAVPAYLGLFQNVVPERCLGMQIMLPRDGAVGKLTLE